MNNNLTQRINQLLAIQQKGMLFEGTKRGIEKEHLRVTPNADISQSAHQTSFGSKLTHPYITTDYAESLMEFITPPLGTIPEVFTWLTELHQFVATNLTDEYMWANSMPCRLGDDSSIPIAEYGTSNSGQIKYIYRAGLGYRYGKHMQTIAGLHYNYSLPKSFWHHYAEVTDANDTDIDTVINEGYFSLIRNYLRYGWLINYLWGASPAVDKSFLYGQTDDKLSEWDSETLYNEQACSLRMSDIGYNNNVQSDLKISYNSLDEYTNNLIYATSTSYPDYETFESKHGKYAQLNPNILQIEAEYYAPIRPKQPTRACERPARALQDRGVEYVEIRAIDVNPYSPIGIAEEQAYFIEVFLLYCLLEDSPPLSEAESALMTDNVSRVVDEGRKPGLKLQYPDHEGLLLDDANALFEALAPIAVLLDNEQTGSPYSDAVKYFNDFIDYPDKLYSSRFLSDLKNDSGSFIDLVLKQSIEHHHALLEMPFEKARQTELMRVAQVSLEKQIEMEAHDTCTLDEYIKRYFSAG